MKGISKNFTNMLCVPVKNIVFHLFHISFYDFMYLPKGQGSPSARLLVFKGPCREIKLTLNYENRLYEKLLLKLFYNLETYLQCSKFAIENEPEISCFY